MTPMLLLAGRTVKCTHLYYFYAITMDVFSWLADDKKYEKKNYENFPNTQRV